MWYLKFFCKNVENSDFRHIFAAKIIIIISKI